MRYKLRDGGKRGGARMDVSFDDGCGMEVSGLGDDAKHAAHNALNSVIALGNSPAGVVPQVAAAAVVARTFKAALKAVDDGSLPKLMSTLSSGARKSVSKFLGKVFG